MNLTGVIAEFAIPGGLTVTRSVAGSYVSGVYQDGLTSTIAMGACVQPARPKDVQALPEGLRSEQALLVFTAVALNAATAAGAKGDTFAFEGATYEVRQTEPWNQMAGFYKAIAVKVTP